VLFFLLRIKDFCKRIFCVLSEFSQKEKQKKDNRKKIKEKKKFIAEESHFDLLLKNPVRGALNPSSI
jgi:hypothetical protein